MAISNTIQVSFATIILCICTMGVVHAQVLSPDEVAAAATSAPTATEVVTASSETPVAEESRGLWPKVTLPKVTMPKVTMPKFSMPSWPKNEDGIAKSPLTPISEGFKSGMKSVSDGTKKAWQNTKEMFSFGEKKTEAQPAPVTTGAPKQSLWDRIKGEQPESDSPQTVAEWMSQPRLNP